MKKFTASVMLVTSIVGVAFIYDFVLSPSRFETVSVTDDHLSLLAAANLSNLVGYLDVVSCDQIAGWAMDPDTSSAQMGVHFYRDGSAFTGGAYVTNTETTVLRPDVNKAFNITGNHGFAIPLPELLKDGKPHSIYAHGIDTSGAGPNLTLSLSGKTITCTPTTTPPITPPTTSSPPTGYLDVADGKVIAGWAKDPDYSGPIAVHIYVDGVAIEDELANGFRSDVGSHTFHWSHSPFGAGSHSVTVYAIGVNSSGVPDGQNPALGSTPKTFNTGCTGLQGSAYIWCRDLSVYWSTRQQDTKLLWNDYVKIGINNSYGGTITQLYSSDRSKNLITEHGGGAVQLSLWGYDAAGTGTGYFGTNPNACDATAYTTMEACVAKNPGGCRAWGAASGAHVANCNPVKFCAGWGAGAPWNPIQAQAANCAWNDTGNNVQYSGSLSNGAGWETRYTDPYNFTKTNRMTGMQWIQKVNLGDTYAKLDYSIAYNGPHNMTPHPQEIPAIFTDKVFDHFYYYSGTAPFTDASSPVSHVGKTELENAPGYDPDLGALPQLYLGFPGRSTYFHGTPYSKVTEGWWGACDAAETHCVTVATFDPSAAEAVLGIVSEGNSGYLTLLGDFAMTSGFKDDITVYLFPYKYNKVINGKSIRQRIIDLKNSVPTTPPVVYPTPPYPTPPYSTPPTPPTPVDTVAPTVSITSPLKDATISGSTNIIVKATATDNVAVVGVRFKVDGKNLGDEDLISPYSISLKPSNYGIGNHTISATARDKAGNTKTFSVIVKKI